MNYNTKFSSSLKSFGALNERAEELDQLESNGWQAKNFFVPSELNPVATFDYVSDNTSGPNFEESRPSRDLTFHRRACDRSTLRSAEAARFELENPTFFPHPYRLDPRGLDPEEALPTIFAIAQDEFFELDYLFPLASVIQAVKRAQETPFIARCWWFGNKPKALCKWSELVLQGEGRTVDGVCICYQPPPFDLLKKYPINYLFLRFVVGHEIGHYWWLASNAAYDLRHDIKAPEEIEQAVSLFSIFLIMYRGYWDRRPMRRQQLAEAFEKLDFETTWARQKKGEILARIAKRPFPPRRFRPSLSVLKDLIRTAERGENRLSEDAIVYIRDSARQLAERACHMPFASAAAIINHRKVDTYLSYHLAGTHDESRWRALDRLAQHRNTPNVPPSSWRDYQLRVPVFIDHPMPMEVTLRIARHLADIRLYGDHYQRSEDFMKSTDTERVNDATGRDLGRVLALLLYWHEGEKKPRRFPVEVAKALLAKDPWKLGNLLPSADYFFQWCSEDPDCPEAKDRFLAESHGVVMGRVIFELWGENGQKFNSSLPLACFEENGFREQDLRGGTIFKVFGVRGDHHSALRPFPLADLELY